MLVQDSVFYYLWVLMTAKEKFSLRLLEAWNSLTCRMKECWCVRSCLLHLSCAHQAAGAARPAPGNTEIQARETVMRSPGSYVYQLMSAWARVCCWDMALVPGEEHLEIYSDDGLGGALAVSTDHV